jgi:hypothetical protein
MDTVEILHPLTSVDGMTRNEVVPYYTYLILCERHADDEVVRVNQLILSKWTHAGLLYIKEKAWKEANKAGYAFENGWR